MVWLSLHTNLILNISCDKRWGSRAGRELCPSHFLEMWTAPPLHTPMYYIPLVPVTLWIMLILCCEGCLALPLTNPWVLEGPLWSLRTWPLLTQVWQGCRCPHSSPLTPGAPPDALSAQAFRQKILVKSTTPKECGLLAFDWYSLFQQNLNSVENIVNNLLWHFQTGHVCRTCRVTEAMCFKTNSGSRFQNHKVTLSVRYSAVCQAAALKHNQPLVTTCLTIMPRN